MAHRYARAPNRIPRPGLAGGASGRDDPDRVSTRCLPARWRSRASSPAITGCRRTGKHLPFFDAGSVIVSSETDGIHFDPDAHRTLGEALAAEVRRLIG